MTYLIDLLIRHCFFASHIARIVTDFSMTVCQCFLCYISCDTEEDIINFYIVTSYYFFIYLLKKWPNILLKKNIFLTIYFFLIHLMCIYFQGLTGLGISLLGAVGGIAHHPLQSVMTDGASPRSLAAGVGLGLVGVVTKPLSGAAELLALTGQGNFSRFNLRNAKNILVS